MFDGTIGTHQRVVAHPRIKDPVSTLAGLTGSFCFDAKHFRRSPRSTIPGPRADEVSKPQRRHAFGDQTGLETNMTMRVTRLRGERRGTCARSQFFRPGM